MIVATFGVNDTLIFMPLYNHDVGGGLLDNGSRTSVVVNRLVTDNRFFIEP